MRNGVGNCSSKTGSRRQSRKKTILKHFLKGILKGKLLAPKLRKSADKSLSQPGCSHYNAFRSITSLTRISLRRWQHQMTTIMQPFQCDLPPQLQEPHRTTHTGTTTRCKTHRRKQFATETTPAAPAAQTRYLSHGSLNVPHWTSPKPLSIWSIMATVRWCPIFPKWDSYQSCFIAGCSHFTRKKHKVSCSGFLPKT